jgi:hypothetical protein
VSVQTAVREDVAAVALDAFEANTLFGQRPTEDFVDGVSRSVGKDGLAVGRDDFNSEVSCVASSRASLNPSRSLSISRMPIFASTLSHRPTAVEARGISSRSGAAVLNCAQIFPGVRKGGTRG